MVAFLEKTEGNSDFHEIVDFLASSSIHHALTINATIDSKSVVVTKASIRSSLLFNDVDGTACLTNEAIFQNLALMGYEAVICLATNQKFNFSKLIFNGMLRNLDNTKKKFLMYPRKGVKFSGKVTPLFDSMLVPHQVPKGEDSRDSLEGTNGNEGDQELSNLCTNLSNRVLALESIKDAQAAEISALKSRIKKFEKKCKPSISHHRAWLKSEKRLSMKKRFRKKESVSKQERKKSKPELTMDDS
ncbi:hypothetical protein Tco_0845966, partial [Tanacetum coccineum]